MNVSEGGERPLSTHERPSMRVEAEPFADNQRQFLGLGPPQRLTIAIILLFWALQYVGLSLLNRVMYPAELGNAYIPRAIMTGLGILVSFAMVGVQGRLKLHSLSLRAAVAFAMALVCPLLLTYFSAPIFAAFREGPIPSPPEWPSLAQDYLFRLWVFGSLSATLLAMSYATDIKEREQRIHRLQELAHSAQLRALSNQLNPHFLFNALNSIVTLMSRDRSKEAEAMTENLADFLRTTLALDPQRVISLDEEVALQELYLDIEKVRFPKRLRVSFDIPSDLGSAQLPALITQPLIENSIKYAVAQSTMPVDLRIHARTSGRLLVLTVEDDGGDADRTPTKGAKMGLSNVEQRLDAHYGSAASFKAHPKPTGGFQSVIVIPLQQE